MIELNLLHLVLMLVFIVGILSFFVCGKFRLKNKYEKNQRISSRNREILQLKNMCDILLKEKETIEGLVEGLKTELENLKNNSPSQVGSIRDMPKDTWEEQRLCLNQILKHSLTECDYILHPRVFLNDTVKSVKNFLKYKYEEINDESFGEYNGLQKHNDGEANKKMIMMVLQRTRGMIKDLKIWDGRWYYKYIDNTLKTIDGCIKEIERYDVL